MRSSGRQVMVSSSEGGGGWYLGVVDCVMVVGSVMVV